MALTQNKQIWNMKITKHEKPEKVSSIPLFPTFDLYHDVNYFFVVVNNHVMVHEYNVQCMECFYVWNGKKNVKTLFIRCFMSQNTGKNDHQ